MQNTLNDDKYKQGVAELVTVLVAVTDFQAKFLTVNKGALLPYGELSPIHRSLQTGVRDWVDKKTAQPLGYVEQLYTFIDINRKNTYGQPLLYISYLGLVSEEKESHLIEGAKWCDWYDYFPWEDVRNGYPWWVQDKILPRIKNWVEETHNENLKEERLNRMKFCWGLDPYAWSEDHSLLRYELLYEVGLIKESPNILKDFNLSLTGIAMENDHRRVLATALARLRVKIKYRPVIFELMPPYFSLLQLQKTVEVLIGRRLHKQNFRRQVQAQKILEATKESINNLPGRPAKLYRFNDSAQLESLISGTRRLSIKS